MLFAKGPAVRSDSDVAKMRKAGLVVAEMHEAIRAAHPAPSVTTGELDRIDRRVRSAGGPPRTSWATPARRSRA